MTRDLFLVSPVHPVAAYECHGGLSSAVCFPPSGYKYYLQSQPANTLTQSMHLNQEQYSTAKHLQI